MQDKKEELVAEYEKLRDEMLKKANRISCHRHGMVLFVREGMKAWCETISAFTITKSSKKKRQANIRNYKELGLNIATNIIDRETVVIVSNMILGVLKEACV